MTLHKNTEFIKIGNSKTVTVTLTFDVDNRTGEDTILRNAAQAATRLADIGDLHVWVRKVEVQS